MSSHYPAAYRRPWRTVAAQLLIGTLTCHATVASALLAAPRAFAEEAVPAQTTEAVSLASGITGLVAVPGEAYPTDTINRTNDHAVAVRATVPAGTASVRFRLTDTAGKAVVRTATVSGTTAETTVHASTLADGQVWLHAAAVATDGTASAWTAGPVLTKDTVRPAKPTIVSPADRTTIDAASMTVSGQAPAGAIVRVLRDGSVVASAASDGAFSAVVPLALGANSFRAESVDAAWNESVTVRVPVIERMPGAAAPAEPESIPAPTHLRTTVLSGSRVRLTWSLPQAALTAVDHFAVFSDDRTGTVDFSQPIGTTADETMSFTTAALPRGTYAFVIRSVNADGTMSTNTDSDTATVRGTVLDERIPAGSADVSFLPDQPVTVTTGADSTRRGELRLEPLGRMNPGSPFTDLTSVGNFYELTTTNQTVFPLTVTVYYTAADLAAGHVTSERQVKGLYFYDTAARTWRPFEATTVNTADIVVDGVAYAGSVSAVTTHLTAFVIAADTVAPLRPSGLTAEAGNGRAKLTWHEVADAAGYWIRYRPATNIDTDTYATVFVSGSTHTSYTVSGLQNGTLYEFGIAAEDAAGNQSAFSVVEQTPTTAGPTTDFITPATARLAGTHQAAAAGAGSPSGSQSSGSGSESSNTRNNDEDQAMDDGTVKGGSDQADETKSSRSLVTLLIVLIAAAAGFGGYYGYQWWTARPEEFDEPFDEPAEAPAPKPEPAKEQEKERPKDKPAKQQRTGGRW